ncbi:MAG: ribosome biogenesis factor YjgA [Methylococcaceae bacterium]
MSKYFGRDVETQEDDIDDYEYDKDGNIVYYAIRPNKTQIKKEYETLFAIGEQMSKLSATHLTTLNLPPKIHEAVEQVGGMPLNNARKRLLKYIAGQLYKIDRTDILEQLAKLQNKNAHATREHHLTERWRDRLLNDGDKALTALLDEYPQADRQALRQLVRNAQKEAESNKPPKSARLLYQHLKELFESQSLEELALIDLNEEELLDADELDFDEDDEDFEEFDFEDDEDFDEDE